MYDGVFVVCVDFDYFKYVNDMFGYVVGDYVLVFVFEVILVKMGLDDIVVCVGGDEFIMLLKVGMVFE